MLSPGQMRHPVSLQTVTVSCTNFDFPTDRLLLLVRYRRAVWHRALFRLPADNHDPSLIRSDRVIFRDPGRLDRSHERGQAGVAAPGALVAQS